MDKQIGVLILHGIGRQEPGYAQPLIDGITANLHAKEAENVAFTEVLYADVFETYQRERQKYLNSSSHGWQIITRLLRKLLIFVLSDATSYKDKSAYQEIQQRLSDNIANLQAQLSPNAPIIIAAHSLGVMVVSDYIYDQQEGKNAGLRLVSIGDVKALVSFGCNIPLFEMGHKKTVCIKAPSPEFVWSNFFSPFDVLGYKVAGYYNEKPEPAVKIEDTEIICGGILKSWNILSHLDYWDSSEIHIEISKIIRKHLM